VSVGATPATKMSRPTLRQIHAILPEFHTH
jgi:hypothetical protein